jgi:peroxiredoxin Q/BCP
LQSRHDDFKKGGNEIVAISSSSPEDHEKLAKKIGAAFPILSDPGGEAFRRYGILHEHALPGFDLPVARPAVFLIDGKGIIRKRFLTDNWRVRERPEHLLAELKGLE